MKILTKKIYELMQTVGTNHKKTEDSINQKKRFDNVMKQYNKHRADTIKQMKKDLSELYNLHDTVLTKIIFNQDGSIEFIIDPTQTFTEIRKIRFDNVFETNISKDLQASWILYTELYIKENQLDFQLLISDIEDGLESEEIFVMCSDITID